MLVRFLTGVKYSFDGVFAITFVTKDFPTQVLFFYLLTKYMEIIQIMKNLLKESLDIMFINLANLKKALMKVCL